MATESGYPPIDIPNIDVWNLLFERKIDFSSEKGTSFVVLALLTIVGVCLPYNLGPTCYTSRNLLSLEDNENNLRSHIDSA